MGKVCSTSEKIQSGTVDLEPKEIEPMNSNENGDAEKRGPFQSPRPVETNELKTAKENVVPWKDRSPFQSPRGSSVVVNNKEQA